MSNQVTTKPSPRRARNPKPRKAEKPDPLTPPSEWVITSSVLNTIWGDLFGRMIPLLWAGGPPPLSLDEYLAVLARTEGEEPDIDLEAYHDLCKRYVFLYIDLFDGSIDTPTRLRIRLEQMDRDFREASGIRGDRPVLDLRLRLPARYFKPEITDRFRKRLALIRDYLEDGVVVRSGPKNRDIHINSMPIRFFKADDVFDFILGSSGLDLFLPASPFSAEGGTWKDRLANVYRAYMYRKTGSRSVYIPLQGPGFPRERASIQLDSPGGPSNIQLEEIGALKWLTSEVPGSGKDQEGALREWLAQVLGPGVDAEAFITCLRPVRAWQLRGAVYRAILAEFPRIIANLWLEEVTGKTRLSHDYCMNSDTGLRQVFERRLELGLPFERSMVCRGVKDDVNWEWTDTTVRKCTTDVLISEKGFLFPAPGPAPKADFLLKSWIDGTAGNPVFTDCIPPGDAN